MATAPHPDGMTALPRSVQWRLCLGLLKSPAESAGAKPTLAELIRHNLENLREERSYYEKLQAFYGNHLLVANSDNQQQNEDDEQEEGETGGDDEPMGGPPPSRYLDPLSASPLGALDPLTAMLQEQQVQESRRQELDLRYRKERARRKRGLATEAKVVVADREGGETTKKIDTDTLNVVDKDLLRLPSPEISDFEGHTIHWETSEQRNAWIESLREILYIYGQEHPHIGYRQGMHEVISYLWLALEMDRKVILRNDAEATTEYQNHLSEECSLLLGRAAAYTMLRSILGHVRQAFDVKVASNSRPLEDMSHSILAKIKQHHNYHGVQDRLTPLLLSLSVPPQLYCTKWIRLLFSREVVGAQNVILLWDVFIHMVSEGWEWMAILETTAASRILLYRDQLLDSSLPDDDGQAAHHHRAMDLLMNMPPMDDIEPLVGRVNGLLELQKYTQCMHQEVAQQDDASHRKNPLFRNGNTAPRNHRQYSQNNAGGFPVPGDDISSVFSLKSLRQSLEQGAQQLSSSSDTWKKRLVEEWNGLKQPPALQQEFQQKLPQHHTGTVPAGYPRPVAVSMNPLHAQHGMTSQQPMQQRIEQPQTEHGQHAYARTGQSPTFGAPRVTNANGKNNFMGPGSVPTPTTRLSSATHIAGTTSTTAHVANHAQNVSQAQTRGPLPLELAHRLGKSVAVLQEFVMSVARPPSQNQFPSMLAFQNDDPTPGPPKVPTTVWEALAEVEAVRNVLLQHSSQNRFL